MEKFKPKYKKDTDYTRLTKLKDWWKMVSENFEDLSDGVSGWTEKLLAFLKETYIPKELKTNSETEYKVLSDNNFTDEDKGLLYILQSQIAQAVMPENLINISYLFADGRNDSLREKLDTSYAVVMDYTYRRNIMAELTVRADNCESMQHAFDGAYAESINFPNSTPKLQLANHIFNKCSKLTSVTGLDLTNATTLKYAFYICTLLTSIDLISTENVTDMSYAFYGCASLSEIIGINTHKSTNLDGTFAKSAVTELTLDCTNVITAKGTFTDCTSLSSLTILNAQAEVVSELFSSLPETEGGTITLTGCVDITEEITAIATEKGWTVV